MIPDLGIDQNFGKLIWQEFAELESDYLTFLMTPPPDSPLKNSLFMIYFASHLLYQELLQVGHLLADLLLELLLNVLVASTTSSFTCPHFCGSLLRFVENQFFFFSIFSFSMLDSTFPVSKLKLFFPFQSG